MVLRRLLVALAEARLERCGRPVPSEQLFAVGWPDQILPPSSAKNRLHVAIAALRKEGLWGVLETDSDGYLLSPAVPVEMLSTC